MDDHDHGHDHHHHDHHHDGGHDRDRGGEGPEGTDFLDLELTQAVYGGALEMKTGVMMDIVRGAMRERLEQRLGKQLAALGRIAADEIADDFEASLEIEARILERQARSSSLQEKLQGVLRGGGSASASAGPTRRKAARKKRGSRR